MKNILIDSDSIYTMTAEMCARYGIRDLLPHENILNFHVGVPVIPSFAQNISLKGMLGAGDLNQGGILNVNTFTDFNVYICYPWDNNGSLRENVEAFLKMENKLLCFIDLMNTTQLKNFTTVFKNKFTILEGYGPHTPHLNIVDISCILVEGGKASNIYERGANITSVPVVREWLQNPFPNYIARGHIFDIDDRGTYKYITTPLKEELAYLFREAIRKRHSINRYVRIDEAYFSTIDSWSLEQCQSVLHGLLFEEETPVNMIGIIQQFIPSWNSSSTAELIYTKVSPDFCDSAVDIYIEKHGKDSNVERLHMIRDKILEDISKQAIYGGKAKYNTYRKQLSTMSLHKN